MFRETSHYSLHHNTYFQHPPSKRSLAHNLFFCKTPTVEFPARVHQIILQLFRAYDPRHAFLPRKETQYVASGRLIPLSLHFAARFDLVITP